MPRLSLAWHILSLELRKRLSYRAEFWLSFLGGTVSQVVIAWFLWGAVFKVSQADTLGGYTFHGMMLYFLLTPMFSRVIKGQEMDIVAGEIYDGSLTRYLIYPLDVFLYKYLSQVSAVIVGLLQFVIGIVLVALAAGFPQGIFPSADAALRLIPVIVTGSLVYFFIAASLEMVAFWQDNVWSLTVLLRFTSMLLGGGMIPMALFPDWAHAILLLLPFQGFLAFPAEVYLGTSTGFNYWGRMLVMSVWTVLGAWVARSIWRRGVYQYTGVGM